MEALAAFLKSRADHSYRYLLAQIEDLSPEAALAGGRSDWPDHRWGVGQNGSIAGIVYHVAAWKQMTIGVFQTGGRPMLREEFDASTAPALDDWEGIRDWLQQIGQAWSEELAALMPEAFDTLLVWEGMSLPMAKFVAEIYEHDIQHAAQIEYLRQQQKGNEPS